MKSYYLACPQHKVCVKVTLTESVPRSDYLLELYQLVAGFTYSHSECGAVVTSDTSAVADFSAHKGDYTEILDPSPWVAALNLGRIPTHEDQAQLSSAPAAEDQAQLSSAPAAEDQAQLSSAPAAEDQAQLSSAPAAE